MSDSLPRLPQACHTIGFAPDNGLYTADQMRDYARAALAAGLEGQPADDDKPLAMALELASAWRRLFEAVAKELGCLPSTYVKGNDHVIRKAHALRLGDHAAISQRPAFVSALRGLVDSLQREPTEFELRAAAHELTVKADRIAAAARSGGDDA